MDLLTSYVEAGRPPNQKFDGSFIERRPEYTTTNHLRFNVATHILERRQDHESKDS
jgi:hypothetical protein